MGADRHRGQQHSADRVEYERKTCCQRHVASLLLMPSCCLAGVGGTSASRTLASIQMNGRSCNRSPPNRVCCCRGATCCCCCCKEEAAGPTACLLDTAWGVGHVDNHSTPHWHGSSEAHYTSSSSPCGTHRATKCRVVACGTRTSSTTVTQCRWMCEQRVSGRCWYSVTGGVQPHV